MTIAQLCPHLPFEQLVLGDPDAEVTGVYCGDLLSHVMGKAQPGQGWVTVMTNLNTIAVASLADLPLVIFSDGSAVEENVISRAKQQHITLLRSSKPVFETALILWKALGEEEI